MKKRKSNQPRHHKGRYDLGSYKMGESRTVPLDGWGWYQYASIRSTVSQYYKRHGRRFETKTVYDKTGDATGVKITRTK